MGEPIATFRTPGVLPVTTGKWYELREAARFSLYRWDEFLALSAEDQAGVVAYYRTYNKLQALIGQHQEHQMKINAAKAGRRRP